MDFVHDQFAPGQKLRTDHRRHPFARLSGGGFRFAYRGAEGVQTPERVCRPIGCPQVDNGRAFTAPDLDRRASANEVTPDVSRPGKSADNGFFVAVNSNLRAECPNARRLMDPAEDRERAAARRRDCNKIRPHSAIG